MYNTDSDSLDTGAPDITITGNQRMASAPDPTAEMNDFSMQVFGKPLHQLTPPQLDALYELMNEQSKAPQQDSGIMAAAPTGTYTQNRKNNMMAYGGIAGADGRKAYGLGSWLQKQKDKAESYFLGKSQTQIDNESQLRVDREQSINRPLPPGFDITKDRVDKITPIGDPQGTGPYTPGYEQIFDIFRPDEGGVNLTQFLTDPGSGASLDDFIFNRSTDTSGEDQGKLPLFSNFLGLGVESLKPYLKYQQTIKDPVKATQGAPIYGPDTGGVHGPEIIGYQPGTPAQSGEYRQTERVNPLYPIAAGLGVGKYVSGLPKDTLPMDTTSIDPAAIAAAAQGTDAQGIAAGLRFLPEQVTRAAEGGRIGYAGGGPTYKDFQQFMREREQMYRGMDKENILKDWERYKRFKEHGPGAIQEAAQGGRIGYREGEGVESIPTDQMQSIQGQQAGGEYNRVMELMLKIKENIPLTEDEQFELRELMKTLNMSEAPGRDRVMAQEGGLMNLGGMEKDYRNEGGFVALGGEEKADDVPARLSKNEFVFTADAVRNAGGGDIDQGAEIMENMMKNLEAGGEVSEDSQGLEGARGMFANAQKLQNRII